MNIELDRNFLRQLWNNENVLCPICNSDYLVLLHKKRHDNNDFVCPKCKKIYRTMNILQELLEREKYEKK